jgi:peroxiredoxin
VSCSHSTQQGYIIDGELNGLTDAALYVVTQSGADAKIDTLIAQNGKFHFSATADSVCPVVFYLEEKSVWFTVYAQNGDRIELSGDAEYPELIQIKGNTINDLLTEFRQNNDSIFKALNDSADSNTDYLCGLLREKVQAFIRENPQSVASLVLIQDHLVDSYDLKLLREYLSLIENPAQKDPLYTRLNDFCNRLQQTEIGAPAPEFTVLGIDNDTLSLQSFDEKYLLLAFNEAENNQCTNDLPTIKQIKRDYAKKNLAVLTIYFNENTVAWKAPAKKYKIDWEQAIDALGWASPILAAYNVNHFPDYYLIDKEQHIVLAHADLNEIKTYLKNL